MFKYDMGAPIPTILARSELRNALMTEWPSLVATDINAIASETELVAAIAQCTGRNQGEAEEVVAQWMALKGLPPHNDDAVGIPDRLTPNGMGGDELPAPAVLN
ncbi:hypothetical protein [Pelagibacterium montanilacus]|uniref:hypothetical protein n=1 Tax=Pelagibacterium montanilacus TaxID=2185280 RepID=UPI000F8C4BEC|nr:hypothetical protein [Pelagibacterium montanilacus]